MPEHGQDLSSAIIPAWVLDADIHPQAKCLYAVLYLYADNGEGLPSRRGLANRLHCPLTTIDRATVDLVGIGALTITDGAWNIHHHEGQR